MNHHTSWHSWQTWKSNQWLEAEDLQQEFRSSEVLLRQQACLQWLTFPNLFSNFHHVDSIIFYWFQEIWRRKRDLDGLTASLEGHTRFGGPKLSLRGSHGYIILRWIGPGGHPWTFRRSTTTLICMMLCWQFQRKPSISTWMAKTLGVLTGCAIGTPSGCPLIAWLL